jgi:hypothetical protein
MSFLKRLLGRRDEAAIRRAEAESVETPAERQVSNESVDDVAADEFTVQQLGGEDPSRLVDDEFKP